MLPATLALASLGLPTPAPGNLLRNPGFEDGIAGWVVECSTERCNTPTVDATAHSGGGAALLSSTSDRWSIVALRQDARLASHCRLRLDAWARVDRSSELLPAAELHLAIGFLGAAGELLAEPACRLERQWPPNEWTQMSLACRPPAAGQSARMWVQLLSVRSDAAALVDDLSLGCDADADALAPDGHVDPTVVPPSVHFIFGLASDFGGKPFGLVHHLVVKSALRFVTGSEASVYFYHAHEPAGEWWDATKPLLALRRVRAPSAVFGRPLRRFAHQADVIRLEVLLSFGGVYLDLDVMLLAPLAPLMRPATSLSGGGAHTPTDANGMLADAADAATSLSGGGVHTPTGTRAMLTDSTAAAVSLSSGSGASVVLAQEGVSGSIGLGNALMLTPRNHSFFWAWYAEYRHFTDAVWNGFSVRLPSRIAARMPDAVREVRFGLYTIFPSPILYGVRHKRRGRWGGRMLRNGRAIVLQ